MTLGLDRILFGKLRACGADAIIIVMASFGASMALRSLLEFIFTAKPAYFTKALQIAKPLGLGMRATPDQLLVIGMTAVLVVMLHLLVTCSATGRAMRAVSENPSLAGVYGGQCRECHSRHLDHRCGPRLHRRRHGRTAGADPSLHGA